MVITRRHINGHTTYTLDGEKVSRAELEARCAKYFSVYGMRSMFKRLLEQDTLLVEIESKAIYEGIREMCAEDELESAKKKIAELESKLEAIKVACT